MGHRNQTGRHRRGRTAARAPRAAGGIPWVARRAVPQRLGGDRRCHLRDVRASEGDEPGRTEPLRQPGVVGRVVVGILQRSHAEVLGVPGEVGHRVLQQERHAAEGPVGHRSVGRRDGAVELTVDDGVQLGVELLDAGDGGFDELTRVHLAAANEVGGVGGVEPGQRFGLRFFLHGLTVRRARPHFIGSAPRPAPPPPSSPCSTAWSGRSRSGESSRAAVTPGRGRERPAPGGACPCGPQNLS